jgi:DNA polymerase I-like protein with 3'-5' exonuclease and polymerase domains
MLSLIRAWKPKVIIALGSVTMRQLGFKLQFKDSRGKLYTHADSGTPVIVSFSERALMAAPGLFDTFKIDVLNAFKLATDGVAAKPTLEQLTEEYQFPKTIDEALRVCDEIEAYSLKGDPGNWAISVDTETTTLRPEKQDARIIAFCFGWNSKKATTIVFDHPHMDEEYKLRLPELHARIAQLLASPKPKILHNSKFDLKFIELKYNIPVNNVRWDTLLGEHLLDEDKKGNYGLKALTAGFLPHYVGYEDHLYDILNAEESVSEAEETAKKIVDLENILKDEYPEYLESLRSYQKQLQDYEAGRVDEIEQQKLYDTALENYTFCKSTYEGRMAAWQVEIDAWPAGKRGKPKKPTKWFTKPEKLTLSKKPKPPEDPRSKKEKQISEDAGFENVPVHDLQVYGAIDADVTRQLVLVQQSRIKNEKSKVGGLMTTHAVPASRVLGRMEYYGTRVDQKYIDVLDTGLREIVEVTDRELYLMTGATDAAGQPINLNNPRTLGNILYNAGWHLPDGTRMEPYEAIEYTKKQQPSTSEKVLRTYIDYEDKERTIPTPKAYFAERLLRWRKASKALNTFLANVRALSKRDGFLHTQFHLNGTGTGRLSSSDMNMQNVPKYLAGWNIKKLFVPDDDSHLIVNMDYKGAEVRVFTAYARDTALIKALNEGLDMHSFFASKVFGKPYDSYANRDNPAYIPDAKERKALDSERSKIKRVVFGILYGAGPMKIAETIGVTPQEAEELINLLYKMFPAIKTYADDVEKEVLANGWVDTYFHRRRRFPLASINRHKSRAVRQARNFKIQSTSSDIVISQLIEIDEPLRRDMGGRLLLTVHDSIVLQFPKKYVHQLNDFLLKYAEHRVSEKYPWLPVPFKVDIEVGPNYGECQALDKYLAKHPFVPVQEGVIEEDELLTELKEDAFSEHGG